MIIILIAIAVIFYMISALAIAALSTVILDKADMYNAKVIMKLSLFWIFTLPGVAIRLMMTKKGERILAQYLDMLNI